jgi:hypothetical protein
MLIKIPGLLLFIFVFSSLPAQILLKKGLVIHRSVKIKKANYDLDGYDSLKRSVIVIEGNNIVVDFNGAILNGNTRNLMPDQFYGAAIIVHNAKNIIIRNLTAKGYKVAVLAKNVVS